MTQTHNNLRLDTSADAGSTKCMLTLAGSVGIPEGHNSTPRKLKVSLDMRPSAGRSGLAHMSGSPTMSVISSLSGNQTQRVSRISSSPSATPVDEEMRGSEMDIWPLKEAIQSRRLVLVENCGALIKDYPIRIWDELPQAAVVVPIANDSDEGVPSAVIVIGLSIRRPFDENYESFLVSQVSEWG